MDNYSIDNILRERYLLPEENTWSDLAKRVSGLYPDILPYIESKEFVPGSPTLMNACTNGKRVGTLSSCFPMGISDSMDGIMDAMKDAAMVTKMCGGVGYDFSVLRGSNEIVKSAGKPSSGVMGFIYIYNAILEGVRQGSLRRGAGMSLLKCYHPDVLKFINAKADLKKYNRTNFSVKLDHDFYRHLENNPKKVFKVKNIVDGKENGLKDKDGNIYTYAMVWDSIINMAWKCAEPGIFNESYVSERSTLTHIQDIPTCNPCSEFITTVFYLSCCLASIDLAKLVENKEFNWGKFGKIIGLATRFLNAVIDKNVYPLKKIEDATLKARSIGLGVMGLAHMFFKLGIPYDSDEAKALTKDIMLYETLRSMKESVDMARESKPYEWFNYDVFMKANHRLFRRKQIQDINIDQLQEDIKKYGCYNSSQTSVAPTGCQNPNTMVLTKDGILKLKEIINYKQKDKNKWKGCANYFVYNEHHKLNSLSQTYINGFVKTKKLIMKSGAELEGSYNHAYRVLVKNKYTWKKLNEITVGDVLLYDVGGYVGGSYQNLIQVGKTHHNERKLTLPKTLNEDFAKFLGFLYSDGSIHQEGIRLNFNYNEKTIKESISLIYKLFRVRAYSTRGHTCETVYLTSTRILKFLSVNGLLKKKARKVSIPLLIRKSPKKVILSFIHGYWIGDGSITGTTKYIDTFSKKMAYDLLTVLRAVGINSKINKYDASKDKASYSNNIHYRVYFKRYGSTELDCDVRKIKLKERGLKKVCEGFGSNLMCDEVVSVRNSRCMTLDIEVPKDNTYISNSYISHNSISTLAETSSGIEPVFGLVHIRKVETGDKEYSHLLVIDPVFKNHVESKHPNDKDKIYEYVSKHNGSCQGCDYLSKADQKVFKVASDIEPMRHLDILEATSMKTSLSVSKTINLPSSATPEDISKIYLEAYKRGIIGVTVYRDGCREGILVHETNGNGNGKGIERKDAPKRPENLECDVHRVKVGKGHLVVLAGKLKGKLYEVFVAKTEKELEYETGAIKKVKRNHYDFMVGDKVIIDNLGKNFGGSVERTLARFVSMSLRSGVALTLVVEQLTKGDDFFSFDIAVSRVLKKYIKNGEVYEADVCDVCKSKLIYYDGCIKCSNCTWSKCG